jgi:hypothetical protein
MTDSGRHVAAVKENRFARRTPSPGPGGDKAGDNTRDQFVALANK